jgi:hypothetical protein
MELTLLKTQTGALVPMDEDSQARMMKFKVGSVIRADYKAMRNGQFFRKYWALMEIAYDLWSDGLEHQEYQGRTVMPEKDRFRKDISILAGYFRPVFNVNGEMRLEAESIAWANMDEGRFESLYSACIQVILDKVLSHKRMTREALDEAVNNVLRFG